MKTCPNCGASSADNSVFCMNCGARLTEPAPVNREAAPNPQPAYNPNPQPAYNPNPQPTYNTYNTYNTPPTVNVNSTESFFDGTLGQQIGISIVNFLLCLITQHLRPLGILPYLPLGDPAHRDQRPPAQIRRHGRQPFRSMDQMGPALSYHLRHLQFVGLHQAEAVAGQAHAFRELILTATHTAN